MKKRYKIYLQRHYGDKVQKRKIITHAFSSDQAKRFAHIRNPGWTATRAVKD